MNSYNLLNKSLLRQFFKIMYYIPVGADFFEAALVYWLNTYSLIYLKAILFTQ